MKTVRKILIIAVCALTLGFAAVVAGALRNTNPEISGVLMLLIGMAFGTLIWRR